MPLPLTPTWATDEPVPVTVNVKGLVPVVSLGMETTACSTPLTVGANLSLKVVVPLGATVAAGWATTVKSAALEPLIFTRLNAVRSRTPAPVFLMVNVSWT